MNIHIRELKSYTEKMVIEKVDVDLGVSLSRTIVYFPAFVQIDSIRQKFLDILYE